MSERYTQIVSLGFQCATAYNLRRFFNFRSAWPFDWWVTPFEGLCKAMTHRLDVDRIYAPEQLVLTENAASVRASEYGILLHHEFPRDESLAGFPVKPGFHNYIANAKNRTEYLVKKFCNLNNPRERVLFVREEDRPISTALRDELHDILSEFFPLPSWEIAYVKGPPHASGSDWRGDESSWNTELSRLNVELDTSRHRPFRETPAQHSDEDFQ